MRLTRRGAVLTAVVIGGFVLARLHGTRSLGALVLPGAVALGAAALQVWAAGPPRVERTLPPNGEHGGSGRVRLAVESEDATLGRIRDGLPAGVDGDGTVATTLDGEPVTYEVDYAARGRQTFGPAAVWIRDALGLVERGFELPETDSMTVYPRVHDLSPGGHRRLLALSGAGIAPERGEFDHLREFVQGDTLRDIHWAASAKRDDLVVTEYVESDVAERVEIVGEATPDGERTTLGDRGTPADAMAEAVASLALPLLADGVPVTVRTPGGTLRAVPGDRQRVLAHLATATAGDVGESSGAAVHVRASEEDVRVRLGDSTASFAALRAGTVGTADRVAGPHGDDGRVTVSREVSA